MAVVGESVIDVWQVSGRPARVARLPLDRGFESLRSSNDGRQVVAVNEHNVVVWTVGGSAAARKRVTLPAPDGAMAFTPDDRHVAIGRVDGAIDFADLRDQRTQTLRGGRGKILSVSITSDNRFVLGAGAAGDVFVWDLHAPSSPQPARPAPVANA